MYHGFHKNINIDNNNVGGIKGENPPIKGEVVA